jgi:hypothetical protein
MSTTQGPIEPMVGTPPGAIPQPPRPPGSDPEAADPFAPGGDTDVVFRLERDVPVVHRLRELAAAGVDRLFDSWRMVVAAAVGVLALVALTVMVGGAYRHRPVVPPAPPPTHR